MKQENAMRYWKIIKTQLIIVPIIPKVLNGCIPLIPTILNNKPGILERQLNKLNNTNNITNEYESLKKIPPDFVKQIYKNLFYW